MTLTRFIQEVPAIAPLAVDWMESKFGQDFDVKSPRFRDTITVCPKIRSRLSTRAVCPKIRLELFAGSKVS